MAEIKSFYLVNQIMSIDIMFSDGDFVTDFQGVLSTSIVLFACLNKTKSDTNIHATPHVYIPS